MWSLNGMWGTKICSNGPGHMTKMAAIHIYGKNLNQRTIDLVLFTSNLEIQEPSMLYKLSPIQKHQEQIWPCHKNGQGQPRVIIWKNKQQKKQGIGIQLLGTSSGGILKLLLFPSFCTSSRKIPIALLFYMIFCFISYMHINPRARRDNPWGQFFFMQAGKSYHFHHWLHV